MAKYGIPYMGSKDKIAESICRLFPKADNFYDLFGGGFSISHCIALKRKDFKRIHYNEIRSGMCKFIEDCIAGKYSYENFLPKWISREEFYNRINEPYVKLIWSFGNNGKGYLFGKDIEKYKRSLHNAVIFNNFNAFAKKHLGISKFKDGYSIKERRLFVRYRGETPQLKRLQKLQQLEGLERLQQLDRLQGLQRKITFSNLSYENVEIDGNSIIYCDPPYKGTAEYDGNKNFNHAAFLDWASDIKHPVFISEYDIKDARFRPVNEILKKSLLSSSNNAVDKVEKLYMNPCAIEFLKKQKAGHRTTRPNL